MASDTVEKTTGAEGRGATAQGEAEATWSAVNAAVIAAFFLLTLVGLLISTGYIKPLAGLDGGGTRGPAAVPPYVYLYAGLGALGYIFTKLMVQFDDYDEWNDAEALAAMLMRVPAALILAAGVYLLIAPGIAGGNGGSENARFVAGVAFLVGLYVNVALKSLGGLADRILGRGAQASESKSNQG